MTDETLEESLKKLRDLTDEETEVFDVTAKGNGAPEIVVEEIDISKIGPSAMEPVKEGGKVRIEGQSLTGDKEDIILTGKVRGVSPVVLPNVGVVGYEYIVELDDTSILPTDSGAPYPYSCITVALESCIPVGEDDD